MAESDRWQTRLAAAERARIEGGRDTMIGGPGPQTLKARVREVCKHQGVPMRALLFVAMEMAVEHFEATGRVAVRPVLQKSVTDHGASVITLPARSFRDTT